MSMRSAIRITAAILVVLWAPLTIDAADPFYERLLQDGIQAHDRGDSALAVKNLRLACFGLLDEPSVLARGLTYLAIAQADVGDESGFARTFDRILEVEDRFQAFSALDLDAEHRQALDAHLHRLIEVDVLSRSPAFRDAAQRKLEEQVQTLAPAERRLELERLVAVEPESPTWGLLLAELKLDDGEFEDVLVTAEALLSHDPRLERALCLRGRAGTATGACEQALADLESCRELVAPTVLLEARLRCLVQLGDWPGASTVLAEVPADRQRRPPFRQFAREVRKGLKEAARKSPPAAPPEGEASGQGVVAMSDPAAGSEVEPGATPDSLEADGAAAEAPVAEAPVVEAPVTGDPVAQDRTAEAPPAEAPTPESTVVDAAAPKLPELEALSAEVPSPEAPSPEESLTAPPEPAELRAELERIQQLVSSSSRDQLSEAFARARELADRYRQLTEPQHLAAEIAYRLSRWQDAVAFFERGGEPSGYPDRLFYFSVALFKTGDQARARRVLEQCLPSLERTAYVQSYVTEILGTDPDPVTSPIRRQP